MISLGVLFFFVANTCARHKHALFSYSAKVTSHARNGYET